MMSNRTQVLGVFSRLIIYILGIFSFIYVFRVLNVKNAIIGYFYTEPDVVKISDFEYDFKSLLFTNSGASDNEYFARVNAKPVSNFDKTKKYTVTINGIQANRVYGDFTYINSNFTNTFISTQDTALLTDTLNIKINFYTEETIIVFTTQSGEKAINLWSSYIAKNGFVLKIVEDKYTPQIEADNLPTYTVNLLVNNEIFRVYEINCLTKKIELPQNYLGEDIKEWVDNDGNVYTIVPLKDIDLHAVFWLKYKVVLHIGNEIYNTVEFDQRITDAGKLPTILANPEKYHALTVKKWVDNNGVEYTNIPTQNIDLYAECYPAYDANLYVNNILYKTYLFDEHHSFFFPTSINDNEEYLNKIICWKDINGNICYSTETLTSNIDLYIALAEDPVKNFNIAFNSSTVNSFAKVETQGPKQYQTWCVKLTGEKIYFNSQSEYVYISNYFKKFLTCDSLQNYTGGQLYNLDIDITNLNGLNFQKSYNGKEKYNAINSDSSYPFLDFRELNIGCDATTDVTIVANINFYLSFEEITTEYWIPKLYITYFHLTTNSQNPYGVNNSTWQTINSCKTQIWKECYKASEPMTFEVKFKISNSD